MRTDLYVCTHPRIGKKLDLMTVPPSKVVTRSGEFRPALSQIQRLQSPKGSPVAVKVCNSPGQSKSQRRQGTHPSVNYLQIGDRNASVHAPGQPLCLFRDGPRTPLTRHGAQPAPERQQIARLEVWGVFSGEDSQATG